MKPLWSQVLTLFDNLCMPRRSHGEAPECCEGTATSRPTRRGSKHNRARYFRSSGSTAAASSASSSSAITAIDTSPPLEVLHEGSPTEAKTAAERPFKAARSDAAALGCGAKCRLSANVAVAPSSTVGSSSSTKASTPRPTAPESRNQQLPQDLTEKSDMCGSGLSAVEQLLLHAPQGTDTSQAESALSACHGHVGYAVQLLTLQEGGGDEQALMALEYAMMLEAVQASIEHPPTDLEVTAAVEHCGGDEEQARMLLRSDPLELAAAVALTSRQKQALAYVQGQASSQAQTALLGLELRWREEKLPGSVEGALRYIRDAAPIIVHVTAQVLGKLVNDTHYRSMFQTNTSRGTRCRGTRTRWEASLFGSCYDGCQDGERVKYGCLNFTQDQRGVRPCQRYGTSYLLLKHVRIRCTFADRDTGGSSPMLGTCQHYAHVLQNYTREELAAVAALASGQRVPSSSRAKPPPGTIEQYREVQVHGPVELSKHVEVVMADTDVSDAICKALTAKHGIPVVRIYEPGASASNSSSSIGGASDSGGTGSSKKSSGKLLLHPKRVKAAKGGAAAAAAAAMPVGQV
eukprot:TRINITY_DN13270_c1_g2_i1.p1 TRINITY_DN13270_c1_g2~~TRINITY_DN13270_c1_g2_i1.p1  ORF type:complete len:576 (+),score=112.06 TRINITY_DN13270_c1_g2_i1:118-1845(+)